MSKRLIHLRLYCGLLLILFVAAGWPATTSAQNDTDLTLTPSGKVVSGGKSIGNFARNATDSMEKATDRSRVS